MIVKVIIDASQFVHACYNIWQQGHRNAETLEQAVVNNINTVVHNIQSEIPVPISVCLALDSRPSFRSTIYPEYKANRSASLIEWGIIHTKLKEHFMCLELELLEADDVMFCFATEHHRKNDTAVLIVSSDGDANQTTAVTYCIQYCPKKKEVLRRDDLGLWKSKFILGCPQDNVPSVVPTNSSFDALGNPVTKKVRLGEKTIEKLMGQGMSIKDIMDKYKIDASHPDSQRNMWLIKYDYRIYKAYISEPIFNAFITRINSI